jgi:hypothetical protein
VGEGYFEKMWRQDEGGACEIIAVFEHVQLFEFLY